MQYGHARRKRINQSLILLFPGIIPYTTALDLAAYLTAEREYVPWASALYNLGYLESMFSGNQGDYEQIKVRRSLCLFRKKLDDQPKGGGRGSHSVARGS